MRGPKCLDTFSGIRDAELRYKRAVERLRNSDRYVAMDRMEEKAQFLELEERLLRAQLNRDRAQQAHRDFQTPPQPPAAAPPDGSEKDGRRRSTITEEWVDRRKEERRIYETRDMLIREELRGRKEEDLSPEEQTKIEELRQEAEDLILRLRTRY
jgi:hypothetical protein